MVWHKGAHSKGLWTEFFKNPLLMVSFRCSYIVQSATGAQKGNLLTYWLLAAGVADMTWHTADGYWRGSLDYGQAWDPWTKRFFKHFGSSQRKDTEYITIFCSIVMATKWRLNRFTNLFNLSNFIMPTWQMYEIAYPNANILQHEHWKNIWRRLRVS